MSQSANPMTLPATWDLVASDYQADVQPQFECFACRALELAEVRPGDHVIDVACGPGTLSLLACAKHIRVSALDFSPGMIRCLQERATSQSLSLEAVIGSGMELPWPDQTFDGGFSIFGLMFFDDRHKGFCELARVLKPGAAAVVSSWVPMSRVPVMNELYAALAQAVPGLPFGQYLSPLSTVEDCEREMSEGGFRDVHVHECRFEFEVPGVAALWSSMARSTPPVRLVAEKVGPDAWPHISKRVVDTVSAHWGTGPVKVPEIAFLSVGRR